MKYKDSLLTFDPTAVFARKAFAQAQLLTSSPAWCLTPDISLQKRKIIF